MLGLAGHGVTAMQVRGHSQSPVDNNNNNDNSNRKSVLWEDYCKDVGILLQSLSIHLGVTEMKNSNGGPNSSDYVEGFIVIATLSWQVWHDI